MRTVRTQGACLVGTGAELVTVEARFEGRERERTEVVITGLPDPVIRESRGRVVCALEECGLGPAPGRLFLNLVPAARRKQGGALDLPLALSAGAACGHLDPRWLRGTLFLGELGIDGRLHAVPGGLAAAAAARAARIKRIVAPPATAREAACVPGVEALGARSLGQVVAHLSGAGVQLAPVQSDPDELRLEPEGPSLDEVRGHASAKRALAVAAAGGHAVLFVGPPGAGKSMLARRMLRLLPPPTLEERIEITQVLSAAGLWPGGLARARPFRAPHHTTSFAGLVGGGAQPAPGEITLAHRGLLFLDELAEFARDALEALREPLEAGRITICRAHGRLELPARFQLVAAMNPCPCGDRGRPGGSCRCSPMQVERYRRRISGPLLDRIDLRLELAPPPLVELARVRARTAEGSAAPSESELREAVGRALALSRARQGEKRNAELDAGELDRMVPLEPEAVALLEAASLRRGLSARALQSVRRVARSIADLAGEARVRAPRIAEALALRAPLG